MERLTLACWVALAAVHASPAAVLFSPSLVEELYGVPASGASGVLLIHRGALFLAVVAVALFAAFNAEARKAATLLVGTSVIGFLLVYSMAGAPAGALRRIAVVDIVALVPLAFVTWRAWRGAY
jgi:hypothetical protein